MLSVSTSWMTEQDQEPAAWVKKIKAMGFHAVELSYKVTREQLMKLEPLLEKEGLFVSSIHNFCPMPDDEPTKRHPSNYYRLSSMDEHERLQAVHWTKIAVDTAKRVGAKVVVIHAGTLDHEDERSPKLFQLYVDGKKGTDEF
ncbi:MAG: sugar phosphate isomerase/epimerase, partial [Candidatus Omnitrophica bacterium]|nr:sugar phosphate isomerase/epimerase [Candidatus Omnitrophota bacterium]